MSSRKSWTWTCLILLFRQFFIDIEAVSHVRSHERSHPCRVPCKKAKESIRARGNMIPARDHVSCSSSAPCVTASSEEEKRKKCALGILQRVVTSSLAVDHPKERSMQTVNITSTHVDRVYVMHYTKTPSRLAITSSRLQAHGLHDRAVAVTSFDKEDLKHGIADCLFAEDDTWPSLRPGEQSLVLKFYGALYDMVATTTQRHSEPIRNALIVEDDIWMGAEDDVFFDEYFADVLQALPEEYDVVHLGDCLGYKDAWRSRFVSSGTLNPTSQHGRARIFEASNAPCSHAMLVSRAGAIKLLGHALPVTRPLDQHIEFFTKNVTLLRAYYSEHDLFWQESQQSRSGKVVESTGIRDKRLLML